MAVKYICDGCGDEVPYDLVQNATVRVEMKGTVSPDGGQYELCRKCAATLIRESNPKKWVRCSPMRDIDGKLRLDDGLRKRRCV